MTEPRTSRWKPSKPGPQAGRLVRLAIVGVLVLYAVMLVASNTEKVSLDFVFFSADAPLVVALVLVGVIGFLIGAALLARQRPDSSSD